MKLSKVQLRCACAEVLQGLAGHASEKILRTALAGKLRQRGFTCHEEVVLPVLCDGHFVGHNRVDILVHAPHARTGKAHYVAALELKAVRESIHDEERAADHIEQARGYMRCLQNVFSKAHSLDVFTVNFRRGVNVPEVALESCKAVRGQTTGISMRRLRR